MATSQAKRKAAGAGRWFPGSKVQLGADVARYVADAEAALGDKLAVLSAGPLVGVVAPHAGFQYSGPVAGYSFAALKANAAAHGAPDLVVVIGFAHRGTFGGVALMDGESFETPLGVSPLDVGAAQAMCRGKTIRMAWAPHNGEHSAENEIPFVQHVFPGIPLVVAILGDHDPATLNALVDALVELRSAGKRFYVVASSDMLHDANWNLVSATDAETLAIAETLDDAAVLARWSYDRQVFCGIGPVVALMRLARRCGASRGMVLRYRNSGDDHPESRGDWVVGYGAVAFL
jgi:AmmeMemoRadiSam system protein B